MTDPGPGLEFQSVLVLKHVFSLTIAFSKVLPQEYLMNINIFIAFLSVIVNKYSEYVTTCIYHVSVNIQDANRCDGESHIWNSLSIISLWAK